MTIPFWCLAAASLMPYLLFGLAVPQRAKQFGKIEFNNPREQESRLEGLGARLIAAHSNAFEALIIFAPAVVVAHVAGADPSWSSTLALVFIGARVVHAVVYALDLAPLRTLAFAVGYFSSMGLYALAAMA